MVTEDEEDYVTSLLNRHVDDVHYRFRRGVVVLYREVVVAEILCAPRFFFLVFFFFFSSRRRHTRFDCDWSSDVCSSDLRSTTALARRCAARRPVRSDRRLPAPSRPAAGPGSSESAPHVGHGGRGGQCGRERERGGEGKRGDLWGGPII